VGKDYYMTAGGGWPDQLIWHSRDLVNWRPITRALQKFNGRAWASDLTYCRGKFYIYTTQVDERRGYKGPLNIAQRSLLGVPFKDQGDRAFMNVVLWAPDPAGPWSDLIDIGVYGLIDPGHVIDQEVDRFLYFNKGMMIRLAPDGLSTVGELRQVYNGWEYPKDWVVECRCPEAPKLTYHNGYYFLSSAQGGTAGPSTAHMGVIARSKSVGGPWENSPFNPMVHTRSPDEKWWRQGHGTLIDDIEGNWWFLYTGYENGYDHFGKQSLLLPVEWTPDGWPQIKPGVTPTDVLRKPPGEDVGHGMPLSDDFANSELGIQWTYGPDVSAGEAFRVGGDRLSVKASGASPLEATWLGVMPVNHAYEVEVEVTIPETAEGGLLLGGRWMSRGEWATAGLRKGQAFAYWPRVPSGVVWKGKRIFVRMRNNCGDVSCYYSADGKQWTQFENSTRGSQAGQVSLYAAGEGEVVFRRFKYRGLD
jgi:beta-xylosidase